MVQLSSKIHDHENDQDDLVPEFSAEIQPAQDHVRAEEKHFDFEGKEFKETYDEWSHSSINIWYLRNTFIIRDRKSVV